MSSAGGSQTLHRGLLILEQVAGATHPPTIDEIATALALHRSIVYRMVRTLEDHHLIRRGDDGRCRPGARLATLARNIRAPLQSATVPELSAVANELGMTAFLTIRDGEDVVTLESISPREPDVHLAYRPGTRHPMARGAPGLAILSLEPPTPTDRPALVEARRRGWAYSAGEVVPGAAAVAMPVGAGTDAAVAVIWHAALDVRVDDVATRLESAVQRIIARLPD